MSYFSNKKNYSKKKKSELARFIKSCFYLSDNPSEIRYYGYQKLLWYSLKQSWKKILYTVLRLNGLSDYWLMTANMHIQSCSVNIFQDCLLTFAHFIREQTTFSPVMYLTLLEKLCRVFWGKKLLWKEQTLELQ